MLCYGKSETPDSSKGKLSGILLNGARTGIGRIVDKGYWPMIDWNKQNIYH